MVRKYITVNIENIKNFDYLVCKYKFKKGNSSGDRCYVRNHNDGYWTINGICGRKCVYNNTCKYHKNDKKPKFLLNNTLGENNIKLICYNNDYKDKKNISNIIVENNI